MPPPELAQVIPINPRRPDAAGVDGSPVALSAVDATVDGAVDGPVERMLAAVPATAGHDRVVLRECIEATQGCAQAAVTCADACLAEEMVNTADVCGVTARVLSRPTDPDHALTPALLSACWAACRGAREVCEEFLPIHDHCRVCARACRVAERACRALLASAYATDAPSSAPPVERPRVERSR